MIRTDMFGYLRVDAGWLWKPKRLLIHTAPTAASGYQLIGGGESHRVGNGDVVIIPPNAPHMYKNIQEPFRYLVIQTP